MEISKIKLDNQIYKIKDEYVRDKISVDYKNWDEQGIQFSDGFFYQTSNGNYQRITCQNNVNIVIGGEGQIGKTVVLQINNVNDSTIMFGDKIIVQSIGVYIVYFIKTSEGWQIVGIFNKNLSEEYATLWQFQELQNIVNNDVMIYAAAGSISFKKNTTTKVTTALNNFSINLSSGSSLDLRCATCLFKTGSNITYTCNIHPSFYINKAFDFQPDTYYVICVDSGVIYWSELKLYSGLQS